MSDLNLIQRMARITAEMPTVAKNLKVDAGKSSYKAVSERDIIDAVKPLEAKWGVYSYPVSRETEDAQILTAEGQYGKSTKFYCRIKTVYRFVNVDDPKDFIDMEAFAVGIDTQDKGDGKAATYCDKYALMKAYKISTGEDPDADPSTEEKYTKTDLICAACGNPIRDGRKKNGNIWPAAQIAKVTKERFGRTLCEDCGKAAASADEN